jgi:Protein of unknown function (DUF1161)
MSWPMVAVSAKNCDDLKAEIEARIRANGVSTFALEVVPSDAVDGRKVVGSCAGGQKKIVYSQTSP